VHFLAPAYLMAVCAPVGVQTKEQHIVEFCKLPSVTIDQNTIKWKKKVRTGNILCTN